MGGFIRTVKASTYGQHNPSNCGHYALAVTEIVRRMLSKGMSIEEVAELTELSVGEIERLQRDQTH